MVYLCGFARSEIIPKNARELGVGRGQFHSGVNGLIKADMCTLLNHNTGLQIAPNTGANATKFFTLATKS